MDDNKGINKTATNIEKINKVISLIEGVDNQQVKRLKCFLEFYQLQTAQNPINIEQTDYDQFFDKYFEILYQYSIYSLHQKEQYLCINKYKKQATDNENQINELKAQISELQRQLLSSQHQGEIISQFLCKYNSQINLEKRPIFFKDIDLQISYTKSTIDTNCDQIIAYENQIQQIENNLKKIQSASEELQKFEKQCEEESKQYQLQFKPQLKDLTSQLNQLNKKKQQLQLDLQIQDDYLREKQKELAQLNQDPNQKNQTIIYDPSQITQLEQDIKQLNSQIEKTKSQKSFSSNSTKVSKCSSNADNIQQKISEKQEKIEQMKKIKEKGTKVKYSKSQYLIEVIDEINKKKQIMNEENQALEQKMDELRQEVDQVQSKISDFNQKNHNKMYQKQQEIIEGSSNQNATKKAIEDQIRELREVNEEELKKLNKYIDLEKSCQQWYDNISLMLNEQSQVVQGLQDSIVELKKDLEQANMPVQQQIEQLNLQLKEKEDRLQETIFQNQNQHELLMKQQEKINKLEQKQVQKCKCNYLLKKNLEQQQLIQQYENKIEQQSILTINKQDQETEQLKKQKEYLNQLVESLRNELNDVQQENAQNKQIISSQKSQIQEMKIVNTDCNIVKQNKSVQQEEQDTGQLKIQNQNIQQIADALRDELNDVQQENIYLKHTINCYKQQIQELLMDSTSNESVEQNQEVANINNI